MKITTEPKTWGEREGVTLELLSRFTKQGDQTHGKVHQVWNYRGDCTQSGDIRLASRLGEEAYHHHHWDAVAFNGGVVVVVPRWKFEEGRKSDGVGLHAHYWWAMSEIVRPDPAPESGIRPCTQKQIAAVVPETQELLSALPGLEYMHIAKLSYRSTSKPGKLLWRKAPQDVRYFRFAAGYGCIAIAEGAGKR